MTLVDTNVIVDVLSPDSEWQTWSVDRLDECRRRGPLATNEIVFAELSARLRSEADVTAALATLSIAFERIPTAGLFVAGKAYRKYRSAGGIRTTVIPDFFLGAHAEVNRVPILTRDERPYRSYFPAVKLIAP
ncbi:MAG: type II toxin-antitoxin system VapC family toxin [Pseudolabrys sp.]|nr:type II toxin-antitoxin system VapC family toxin [Pseudolabrys sp.]